MAVDITVAQVAADRRVDNIENDTELADVLARYLQTATEMVELRAPAAPTSAQNTAASLLVGYWFDSPPAPAGVRHADAMQNSGAAAVLQGWKPFGVAVVE